MTKTPDINDVIYKLCEVLRQENRFIYQGKFEDAAALLPEKQSLYYDYEYCARTSSHSPPPPGGKTPPGLKTLQTLAIENEKILRSLNSVYLSITEALKSSELHSPDPYGHDGSPETRMSLPRALNTKI